MKLPGMTAWRVVARADNLLDRLNRPELKVLEELSIDASNGEIAQQLCLTVQVVEDHVFRILDKLELVTRLDAVRYARRSGLRAA